MLYSIYSAVKAKIIEMDTQSVIKGIEWYNVQYENTVATTPRIFIEFPEALAFSSMSKDGVRTPLKIRLHLVTQAVSFNDGTVLDSTALNNDTLAQTVLGWLQGLKISNDVFTLRLSGWQHWHKYNGWMITFIEFDTTLRT